MQGNADAKIRHDGTSPWYQSRTLWGIIIAFVVLLGIAEVVVRVVADSDYITQRINQKLASHNSGYRVEIGSVSASLLLCRVNAEMVTISDTADKESRYALTIDTISLSGLNPLKSWLNKGISVQEIRIQTPQLKINDIPIRRYQASIPTATIRYASAKPEPDSFINRLNLKIASTMPYLDCEELIIDNGSLTLGHIRKKDTLFITATEIKVTFSDILFDTSNVESMGRPFFARDFTFDINGPHQIVGDSLYEYRIGHLTGSYETGTIKLDSASIALIVSEKEFAARREYWAYQFKAAVKGLTLTNVDFTRLIYQQGVAGHLEIDSAFFSMFSDKLIPKNPHPKRPLMAHEAFQKIPWYIDLDSMTIHDGEVNYAERSDDGKRPGTIRFTHTHVLVRNITNDPAQMTDSTPAVLLLSGRVEDSTDISTSMYIPLLSHNFNMSYRGVTGRLNPCIFNSMFVNLNGYRITSGMFDSLKFDIAIRDGHASGTFEAMYRDLDMELISKIDSGQGWIKKIKSTLFDMTKLKNNNLPQGSDDYKVGQVLYIAEPNDPFMKVIWFSLRSGIFNLIGA